MMRRLFLIAALCLAVVPACRKKAANIDGLPEELKGAGLTVEPFQPVDGTRYGAYRCSMGRVEGLEALACEYGDPATLQANKRQVESFIGNAVTGVALDRGKLVLVLSDRARTDPNGKTISRISRAFLGKKK